MYKLFEIYLYICAIIISIAIIVGLIAALLSILVYAYQSFIGFDIFRKFIRKYHNEMKKEKMIKADTSKAFKQRSDT